MLELNNDTTNIYFGIWVTGAEITMFFWACSQSCRFHHSLTLFHSLAVVYERTSMRKKAQIKTAGDGWKQREINWPRKRTIAWQLQCNQIWFALKAHTAQYVINPYFLFLFVGLLLSFSFGYSHLMYCNLSAYFSLWSLTFC